MNIWALFLFEAQVNLWLSVEHDNCGCKNGKIYTENKMGFVRFNFLFLISFFFPVSRIPCRAGSATVSRGPWHAWTSRGASPSPLGCRTAPKPTLPKAPCLSSTSASQASRPPWGTSWAPQASSSRAPPRASASQQSSKTGAPPTLGLSPLRPSTQPSNQGLDC